jgi:hypothetical protein
MTIVQKAQQSFTTPCSGRASDHRHSGSFLHAKHMSVDDDVALTAHRTRHPPVRAQRRSERADLDRDVVADLRRVQENYLRHTDLVTRESATRRAGAAALENLARLTDSLL